MTDRKKLKVVMVGGWGHGGFVINDFAKNNPDNAKLVGMGQTCSEESLWKLPEGLGQVSSFRDYKEMLQEVKADVAVVSTRLDLLNQAAITAAESGCHLICEKPIAATEEQLEKLENMVNKNNLKLILLLNNRANPYLRAVKDVIAKGIIGKVVLVNARKSYPWNENRVEQFPISLGGTIGWVGIHALDFINAATELDFVKVAGMESNQISPDFDQCPDNCGLVFELSNGAHATVSVDYHRPKASKTHGDDWIRVVGTKGTISANLSKGKISCCTDDVRDYQVEIPEKESLFIQYYDYILNKGYEAKFNKITEAAFKLTKACIIGQKAVIEKRVLDI